MFKSKAIIGCERVLKENSRGWDAVYLSLLRSIKECLPELHKSHTIHIANPSSLVDAITDENQEGVVQMASETPGLPFPNVWIDFPKADQLFGDDIRGLLVKETDVNEDKTTKSISIEAFYKDPLDGVFLPITTSNAELNLNTGKLEVILRESLYKHIDASWVDKRHQVADCMSTIFNAATMVVCSMMVALTSKRIILVDKKRRVRNKGKKKRLKGMGKSEWGVCEYKVLSIKLNEEQKRYMNTDSNSVPFGTMGVHWRRKRSRVYQADSEGKGGLFGGAWSGTLTDECVYVNKDASPVKKFVYQDRHVKTKEA